MSINVVRIELVGVAEDHMGDADVENHPEVFTRILRTPVIAPSQHITQVFETRRSYDSRPAGGITQTWTQRATSQFDLSGMPAHVDWYDASMARFLRLVPSADVRVDYADSASAIGIDLPEGLVLDPLVVDDFIVGIYQDLTDPADVPADVEVAEVGADAKIFTYRHDVTRTLEIPKIEPDDEHYPSLPNVYRVRVRVTDLTVDDQTLEAEMESVRDGECVFATTLTLARTQPNVYESSTIVGHCGYDLGEEVEDHFSDCTFVPGSIWSMDIYSKFIHEYGTRWESLPLRFYTPELRIDGTPASTGHGPGQSRKGWYNPWTDRYKREAIGTMFPGPLVCPTGFPVYSFHHPEEERTVMKAVAADRDVTFYVPVYPGRSTTLLVEPGGKKWPEDVKKFENLIFYTDARGVYSTTKKRIVWEPYPTQLLNFDQSDITTRKTVKGKLSISTNVSLLPDPYYRILRVKCVLWSEAPENIAEYARFAVVLFDRQFLEFKARVIRVMDSGGEESSNWDMRNHQEEWAKVNGYLSPFGFSVSLPGGPDSAGETTLRVTADPYSDLELLANLDFSEDDKCTFHTWVIAPDKTKETKPTPLRGELEAAVNRLRRAETYSDKAYIVSLAYAGEKGVLGFGAPEAAFLYDHELADLSSEDLLSIAHELAHSVPSLPNQGVLKYEDQRREHFWRLLMYYSTYGAGPLTTVPEWIRANRELRRR